MYLVSVSNCKYKDIANCTVLHVIMFLKYLPRYLLYYFVCNATELLYNTQYTHRYLTQLKSFVTYCKRVYIYLLYSSIKQNSRNHLRILVDNATQTSMYIQRNNNVLREKYFFFVCSKTSLTQVFGTSCVFLFIFSKSAWVWTQNPEY